MKTPRSVLFFLLLILLIQLEAKVELGVDLFFKEGHQKLLKGKRVGIITNHTGVNSQLQSTLELFRKEAHEYSVVAVFAPEHGLFGEAYAAEDVKNAFYQGIPVYSLHGKTRRPTELMLGGIDVLIYDIQDIGSRTYTYGTTLYYVMEEAAKRQISVIVLDRPNPINGIIVDGPMLQEAWRSFIGYINVPYCHGMTIGELAKFFNREYHINCSLRVIAMRGWKRSMSFEDTGLSWVPSSPNIPEATSPLFYATTGLLGELGIVNIGIGYTLPFKVVGAPWINAPYFSEQLNAQKLPGVHFSPFYYRPFYGTSKGKDCQGVRIVVTDMHTFRPVTTQYLILGMLKTLYPKQVMAQLTTLKESTKSLFCKANGTDEVFSLLLKERYVAWKLMHLQSDERQKFLEKRAHYLLYTP